MELFSSQVTKRDEESSLMQLKEEFRTYEALRREHDAQIVQIATEAGLRISPEQWSSLLYGDTAHKSHMQSIIDKVTTIFAPHLFVEIFGRTMYWVTSSETVAPPIVHILMSVTSWCTFSCLSRLVDRCVTWYWSLENFYFSSNFYFCLTYRPNVWRPSLWKPSN